MMRLQWITPLIALAMSVLAAPVAATQPGEAVYVARFADRIADSSRAALESTGARIIDYEPRHAYQIWARPDQAREAEALEAVRSVAPMAPERKLSPALQGRQGDLRVDVTVYDPALQEVRADLASLGDVTGLALAGSDGTRTTLAVTLPHAAIPAAARLPAVLYIAPGVTGLTPLDEMADQALAGNIDRSTNRPLRGYADWLDELGLDGAGVKVAVVDSGISPLHPDLQGRVERPEDYGLPEGQGDLHFHGTHVAGIIGGDPAQALRDPDGFVYGLGVAPAVQLVDQNALAWPGNTRALSSIDEVTRVAWRAGARISNNSWEGLAEGRRAGYTADTRMADVLSRNADLATPGMEEYLFVFAAGNSDERGPGVPQEAKNIIAVGSTNSGRGELYPLETSPTSVSSFSSRGPAVDGRAFPTVSAPGGNVVSARAPESVLAPAFCTGPLDGAALYATCSGTSMAAPHATGAAALIHQWWKRETGDLPSPALVRTLLVNGAIDGAASEIPNTREGWGRIRLGSVLEEMPRVWEDQGLVFSTPGEQASWVVEVGGSEPLTATLGWSDAPGAVGANPALVNDLDLIVELLENQGGAVDTWLGNAFVDGRSAAGGSADRLHNLESVALAEAEAGTYRITVRAHNLPGDGIPENGDATDQDFALVVRGDARVVETPALHSPIQPGTAIAIDGGGASSRGGSCTLGWILDRFVEAPDPGTEEAGEEHEGVYAAVSENCIGSGSNGEVFLRRDIFEKIDPPQRIGRVALRAPGTGYAFVRIDERHLDLVDPSMKGHPEIPTGVSTAATSSPGDVIRLSGHGIGFHAHEATREGRAGILSFNDGTRHGVTGPTITNGDHGAPVADVTDGNKALGVLTIPEGWLFPDPVGSGVTGLSLEGILADALEREWDMRLRTVGGEQDRVDPSRRAWRGSPGATLASQDPWSES